MGGLNFSGPTANTASQHKEKQVEGFSITESKQSFCTTGTTEPTGRVKTTLGFISVWWLLMRWWSFPWSCSLPTQTQRPLKAPETLAFWIKYLIRVWHHDSPILSLSHYSNFLTHWISYFYYLWATIIHIYEIKDWNISLFASRSKLHGQSDMQAHHCATC